MAALVRHFGDAEDASRPCGICDVCDPAGAVLRLFRRPSAEELRMARAIVDELRAVEYKAAGTLQRSLDASGTMSRDHFDGTSGCNGKGGTDLDRGCGVRKGWRGQTVSQSPTDRGSAGSTRDNPRGSAHQRWSGRGIWRATRSGESQEATAGREGEFISRNSKHWFERIREGTGNSNDAGNLSAQAASLASQLKEWRAAEAKKLRVPAFCVLHDRTLVRSGARRGRRIHGNCWRSMESARQRWRNLGRRFWMCAGPSS